MWSSDRMGSVGSPSPLSLMGMPVFRQWSLSGELIVFVPLFFVFPDSVESNIRVRESVIANR